MILGLFYFDQDITIVLESLRMTYSVDGFWHSAIISGIVPTGIYIEIPKDYEAQVRSRSGLALKKGISVLNSPGTIDADYRGEIGVILINSSKTPFEIKPSDRIAQLVFAKIVKVNWQNSSNLDETERSSSGFGSTGTN